MPNIFSVRIILWLSEKQLVLKRVIEAFLLIFEAWMQQGGGKLTYRLTQIITGHGWFGDYLLRIGREAKANYFHYGGRGQNFASHTLGAW